MLASVQEKGPAARFRAIARPLLAGRGEAGTLRYDFGGLEVWTRAPPSGRPDVLYLHWIGAPRPGRSAGAAGMRALTGAADQAGLTLVLHADPWGAGRMGRDMLRAWYESFGFRATRDRLVPYWPGRLGLPMLRAASVVEGEGPRGRGRVRPRGQASLAGRRPLSPVEAEPAPPAGPRRAPPPGPPSPAPLRAPLPAPVR